MNKANHETVIIVQIEHIDAVNQIEAIVEVSGIDALFVGPYDLSASLGKTGQVDDEEVRQAITRVRQSAAKAGIPVGIFGTSVAAVESYVRSGYQLIAAGIDSLLLAQAGQAIVESLRGTRS
jgi:2-keto-3-deoxy-L-rhamnonate aldolase RhmA